MAFNLDKTQAEVLTVEQSKSDGASVIICADDAKLAELGYRSEFRREFSVRQILHLASSVADMLMIETIFEVLLGISKRQNRIIDRKKGIFGTIKSYIGPVEDPEETSHYSTNAEVCWSTYILSV